VPHVARLEAARAYIEETAAGLDELESPEGHFITEGAIAKYLATEAGNRAADAAIQALGGYGYTREYMVEKIKRDLRITTIYEGTSEIMEMTVSRDRWQQHLKTRGQHYHDRARELEALAASHRNSGADIAALANHALAEAMEYARRGRLTRNQHVMFRLGEMVAWAEGASSLVRRAIAAREGRLPEKGDQRFDAETLCAISRVYAREAALEVVNGGLRWIAGADGVAEGDWSAFEAQLGTRAVHRAQAGCLGDMNQIADALYGR
jgi:alkylation response protein AidB-like acyl-CoA dehydrogenase